MHHGQIDGPLNIELEVARLQRALDNRSQLQAFPQTAEDQVRTDSLHADRFGLAGGVRIDNGQALTKPQARAYQRIQLTGGLKNVQPPHRAQYVLMHVALLTKTLHDLKVGVGAGAFDPKIHSARYFPLHPSRYRHRGAITTVSYTHLRAHETDSY